MIKLDKLFFAGFAVTILGVGFAASKDRADTSGTSNTITTASMPDYGFSASWIQPEGGGSGVMPRRPIVKGEVDRALDTNAEFDSNK